MGPLNSLIDNLAALGFVNTYAVFGVGASLFFIAKAIFSIWLNAAVARFLARIESTNSVSMFDQLSRSNLSSISTWNEKQLNIALNDSTYVAFNYAPMAGSIIFGEGVLLISICVFLAIQNFWMFILMVLYFGLFAGVVSLIVNRRTGRAAAGLAAQTIRTQVIVHDLSATLRQVRTAGTRLSFLKAFSDARTLRSTHQTTLNKLTYLPRYVVESALMLGIAGILLQRSLDGGTGLPATTVAVFLAGSLRLIASLLPLQASFAALRAVDEQARFTFDLQSALDATPSGEKPRSLPELQKGNSKPVIEANQLSFKYPNSEASALESVSFKVPFGSFVGIIGPSGAGKSTLMDLLLGFQPPTSGEIKIDGVSPTDYIFGNPGKIAYVPQRTHIFTGTLLENILLEIGPKVVDEPQLRLALELAQLQEYVDELPNGLQTQIGEGVRELSGGQAQRLALARALYRNPRVLVLDETTSALDPATRAEIRQAISSLAGQMTVFSITHDDTTMGDFDLTLLVQGGQVQLTAPGLT